MLNQISFFRFPFISIFFFSYSSPVSYALDFTFSYSSIIYISSFRLLYTTQMGNSN
jgi:hypothetical protein